MEKAQIQTGRGFKPLDILAVLTVRQEDNDLHKNPYELNLKNASLEESDTSSLLKGKQTLNLGNNTDRRESILLLKPNFLSEENVSERKTHEDIMMTEKKILQILERHVRSPHDARKLVDYLLENNNYFHNLAEGENGLSIEALTQVCMNLKYKKYKPGTVILKEGEPSNGKFYIVYSGQVHVVVKKRDAITEANAQLIAQQPDEFDSNSSSSSDDEYSKRKHDGSPQVAKKSLFLPLFETNSPSTPRVKKRHFISKIQAASKMMALKSNHVKTPDINSSNNNSGSSTPKTPSSARHKQDSIIQKRLPSHFTPVVWENIIQNSTSDSKISSRNPSRPDSTQLVKRSSSKKLMDSVDSLKNSQVSDSASEQSGNKKKPKTLEEIQAKVSKKVEKYGKIKDTIVGGSAFGEAALVSGDPRGATIIAALETEVLIIDAEDFKLIKSKNEPEKKRVIEFMMSFIPDLDQIHTQKIIDDLSYLLEKKQYSKGSSITLEGEFGEDIYILYNGTIQLSKSVIVEENKKPNYPYSSTTNHMRMKPLFKKELNVCILEVPGTFLGEEVLFEKEQTYLFTSKVLSINATLYSINKKKFLYRFHQTTRNVLQEMYEKKKNERAEILKNKIQLNFRSMSCKNFNEERQTYQDSDALVKQPIKVENNGEPTIATKLKIKPLECETKKKHSGFELNLGLSRNYSMTPRNGLATLSSRKFSTEMREGSNSPKYSQALNIGESPSNKQNCLPDIKEDKFNTEPHAPLSFRTQPHTPRYVNERQLFLTSINCKKESCSPFIQHKRSSSISNHKLSTNYNNPLIQEKSCRSPSFPNTPLSLFHTANFTEQFEFIENKGKELSKNKDPFFFKMDATEITLSARRRMTIQRWEIAKKLGLIEKKTQEIPRTFLAEKCLKKKIEKAKFNDAQENIRKSVQVRSNSISSLTPSFSSFEKMILNNDISNVKTYLCKNPGRLKSMLPTSEGLKFENNFLSPSNRKNQFLTQSEHLRLKHSQNSQLISKTPRLLGKHIMSLEKNFQNY